MHHKWMWSRAAGPRPGSLSGITSDTLFILLYAAVAVVADNDKRREGGVKMQPKGASVNPYVIFFQASKTGKFLSLADRRSDLSKDLKATQYEESIHISSKRFFIGFVITCPDVGTSSRNLGCLSEQFFTLSEGLNLAANL